MTRSDIQEKSAKKNEENSSRKKACSVDKKRKVSNKVIRSQEYKKGGLTKEKSKEYVEPKSGSSEVCETPKKGSAELALESKRAFPVVKALKKNGSKEIVEAPRKSLSKEAVEPNRKGGSKEYFGPKSEISSALLSDARVPEMLSNEISTGCTMGFAGNIPKEFITVVNIEASIRKHEKVKCGILVSRSLIVLNIEEKSFLFGKLKICDYIFALGRREIKSKSAFYNVLFDLVKRCQPINMTVQRIMWNLPTSQLPAGYDRAPGYNYFKGILIVYPGCTLGMSIKSHYDKVFVTCTEQTSLSAHTCYPGDCIVDVNGVPVVTAADCNERICNSLKIQKYVVLTIERPVSPNAVNFVRCALRSERSITPNPRLAVDATEIGISEADRIQAKRLPPPMRSIYRGKQSESSLIKSALRVSLKSTSLFSPIKCDPYNPAFVQPVPPKRVGNQSLSSLFKPSA